MTSINFFYLFLKKKSSILYDIIGHKYAGRVSQKIKLSPIWYQYIDGGWQRNIFSSNLEFNNQDCYI